MSGRLSNAGLSRMHEVMARGEIPRLVTLVNQGEDVHVDAMGTVTIGRNSQVQRDTIFRIASLTKPVTAVATMILMEECKCGSMKRSTGWRPNWRTERKAASTARWTTPCP